MPDKDKTSIQVSRNTKAQLDKLGGKGDTYDKIIRRLLPRPKQIKHEAPPPPPEDSDPGVIIKEGGRDPNKK